MKSLRSRLAWRLLVGGALILGAAGATLHWRQRTALTSEFDAALRASAQSLFAFTEQSQGRVLMELAGETMPQFAQPRGANVYLLRETDGREVARSLSLGLAELPLRAGPVDAPAYWDATLPDGRAMRFTGMRFAPFPEDEDAKNITPGLEAVLVVGRERMPLNRALGALRALLALTGAGALAALAALVRWSVRGGLAPLDRLGEAVADMDAATLATRFSAGALPAELRPIAERLNALFARLEASFQRERRFTSNVAHELRTPLAELRALAEVNLSTPATDDEQAESWRDALATTRRMESVALRLLELARSDDPSRVVRREPVELAAALRQAWLPWAGRAGARRLEAHIDLPHGFTVPADPIVLAVILGNLCGNAAEHAPAGTPVRMTATREPGAVVLHFRNRAGTLTGQDLPHLFEPFWKNDAARADGRHHGLGLALAAESAALLGGALEASLHNGDVEFALKLPDR